MIVFAYLDLPNQHQEEEETAGRRVARVIAVVMTRMLFAAAGCILVAVERAIVAEVGRVEEVAMKEPQLEVAAIDQAEIGWDYHNQLVAVRT